MPFKISRSPNKAHVRFPKSPRVASKTKSGAMDQRDHQTLNASEPVQKNHPAANMHEVSQNSPDEVFNTLPPWLTSQPAIEDDFPTESSELLDETAQECLPFMLGQIKSVKYNQHGVASLNRKRHENFLKRALGRLPAPFVGLDASRPWMLYWALCALSTIGEDTTRYRENLISSLKPIQNATGGFGGGPGQYSHLATTYAAVLSLATAGGANAYDLIDRKAMWHWLGRLKQSGGEFEVVEGGEIDVRGALCAMVIVTLLNLPLELPEGSPAKVNGDETFLTGLANWIGRCQTYEGGLGSTPGAEAHGAYTFCGLACLCILGPPGDTLTKHLDFPALLRWLSARQHAPEGGLAGRTNKLVDGCYSHWIGGCWSLVEAAAAAHWPQTKDYVDAKGLFNREGLIRYILCCGQCETGGLRDKPSKPPDAYHTQYCLAGLSYSQNSYLHIGKSETEIPHTLRAAFQWSGLKERYEMPGATNVSYPVSQESDRVSMMHPIYVIPLHAEKSITAYFADNPII